SLARAYRRRSRVRLRCAAPGWRRIADVRAAAIPGGMITPLRSPRPNGTSKDAAGCEDPGYLGSRDGHVEPVHGVAGQHGIAGGVRQRYRPAGAPPTRMRACHTAVPDGRVNPSPSRPATSFYPSPAASSAAPYLIPGQPSTPAQTP